MRSSNTEIHNILKKNIRADTAFKMYFVMSESYYV